MITPTDDPKWTELLEAAREFRAQSHNSYLSSPSPDLGKYTNRIMRAVRAFDPPKPKQYPPMPEWEELSEEQLRDIKRTLGVAGPDKMVYNDIRNALATAKD